jgi:pimeloyl-ACP methyl ester carboxylesterase
MTAARVTLYSAVRAGATPALRLAAHLFLPTAPSQPCASHVTPKAPGLVVGHGAGSRALRHREFCLAAASRGFVVLALDFRGHGDSDGTCDGPVELDISAAAAYLRGHPAVDSSWIAYRGSSMGGFYGLKAAPQAGLSALALLCPASEDSMLHSILDKEATRRRRDTEARSADPCPDDSLPRWDTLSLRAYFQAQDSQRLAEAVDCPVLIVHARGDTMVPFTRSLALAGHLRVETTLLSL